MEWLSVIGLIVLGIGLIVAEVIFVPGTTVVGISGFICAGFGIYLGYDYFGSVTGSIIFAASAVLGFSSLYYSFKSRSWERFSLKDENRGHVNDDFKLQLEVGEKGKTLSSLRPIGKALLRDKEIEVRSEGGYIGENVDIEIIKIDHNKIIVKSIT